MATPNFCPVVSVSAIALALMACGGEAASASHQCRIEGWIADASPAGVELRDGPDRNAAVLGTLPGYIEDGDGRGFGIPVQVTAARQGWFQVEGGPDDPSRSGLPPRPVHDGSGWIPADSVRFRLQSGQGHAEPEPSSPLTVDLGSDWISEFGHVERVHDCHGDWVDVEIRLDYRRDPDTLALQALSPEEAITVHRAWFRNVCANQETTCDAP